jgi:superfamily II DNA/RNA helicase
VRGVRALVLVPTRELCEQVRDHIQTLTFYCARVVAVAMLTADAPMETQRSGTPPCPRAACAAMVVVLTCARVVVVVADSSWRSCPT